MAIFNSLLPQAEAPESEKTWETWKTTEKPREVWAKEYLGAGNSAGNMWKWCIPIWYLYGTHMVLIWYLYGTYMVLIWYLYGTYSIPYGNYLHISGSSICYLFLPFKNTRIEPPFVRKNARSSKYSCRCDKLSAHVVGYLRRLVGHFRGCTTGLACIYQKKLWFAQKGRSCAN